MAFRIFIWKEKVREFYKKMSKGDKGLIVLIMTAKALNGDTVVLFTCFFFFQVSTQDNLVKNQKEKTTIIQKYKRGLSHAYPNQINSDEA